MSFENLEAPKGPAIYNRNSDLTITDATFKQVKQNFKFEYQEDWTANNFYEYIKANEKDKDALAPLLSVFWMDCSDGKIYSDDNPPPIEQKDVSVCKLGSLLDDKG